MGKIIKIAVTGGIGSGKSVVAGMFEELGCFIVDTDYIVRDLYNDSQSLKKEIAFEFGSSVLDANGNIDKKELARIAFSDERKISKLNSIVHPEVKKKLEEIIDGVEAKGFSGCIVVLVPLLVEAGMQGGFDKVILVTADEGVRVTRCIARDNSEESQVKCRMKFQLSDEVKAKYANYVIDNNNSMEKTFKEVEKVYNHIIGINQQN